jgi:hypothetical protein
MSPLRRRKCIGDAAEGNGDTRSSRGVAWIATAARRAAASVEFIEENGGGPGVRLRKRQTKKA